MKRIQEGENGYMWKEQPLFKINSMNKDTTAVMWVVCMEDR